MHLNVTGVIVTTTTHPYISGAKNIVQMIVHLRKAFPSTVTSDTVKKLNIASNNESYVINALQFVGIIDEEGKKTKKAGEVFSIHKDEDFEIKFSQLVKSAYSELFELHGDGAWHLEKSDLIGFFRQSDQTSDVIGGRQANVFKVFRALSGYEEMPVINKIAKSKIKMNSSKPAPSAKPNKKPQVLVNNEQPAGAVSGKADVAVTVRIEINLPGDGSKETYDNIFKSIRENLVDD